MPVTRWTPRAPPGEEAPATSVPADARDVMPGGLDSATPHGQQALAGDAAGPCFEMHIIRKGPATTLVAPAPDWTGEVTPPGLETSPAPGGPRHIALPPFAGRWGTADAAPPRRRAAAATPHATGGGKVAVFAL